LTDDGPVSKSFDYISYGTVCDPAELEAFLAHVLTVNERLEKDGRRATPGCPCCAGDQPPVKETRTTGRCS
jgi:hypothetical protein